VDFSETTTAECLPQVHPGEVLRRDFLEPLGVIVHALALRVPPNRITPVPAGNVR
jgi:plasmid maintenance system antidote protein VapI